MPGTKSKSVPTTVQVADYPKGITDNITKDYVGYTIKNASSITANSGIIYHVVVDKGADTETLVYDKDSMFVKKLTKMTSQHYNTTKRK